MWESRLLSPVGRHILESTPEGATLRHALQVAGTYQLAGLLGGQDTRFQRQLLKRIDLIFEAVEASRETAVRRVLSEPVSRPDLSREEQLLVTILAERYLTLRDPLRTRELVAADARVEYFKKPKEGFDPAREWRLLPQRQDREMGKWIKDYWERMKACVARQSQSARQQSFARRQGVAVAATLAFTTFGHVSHSGFADLKLGDLTTDLLINTIMTFRGSRVLDRETPLRVRYVAMMGYNAGQRNALDAAIYFVKPRAVDAISPAEPGGDPESESYTRWLFGSKSTPTVADTGVRYGFNVAWAAMTTLPKMLVFDIIKGLTCMLGENSGTGRLVPVAGVGYDILTTYVYFNARPFVMESVRPAVEDPSARK
ncbi:MAG TPA: hypothetical protein VFV50_14165 [Bdellovibrionales bacterium]|nr:hypothetical protein [Bdellovibrionales bacterium]